MMMDANELIAKWAKKKWPKFAAVADSDISFYCGAYQGCPTCGDAGMRLEVFAKGLPGESMDIDGSADFSRLLNEMLAELSKAPK
jgi:hypothetical protein